MNFFVLLQSFSSDTNAAHVEFWVDIGYGLGFFFTEFFNAKPYLTHAPYSSFTIYVLFKGSIITPSFLVSGLMSDLEL